MRCPRPLDQWHSAASPQAISGKLSALGGALGIAVGWAGFRGLLAIRPERLARLADAGLSWPTLAFAAAASLAAALIFGLAPAIESFRIDLIGGLRTGGRGLLGRHISTPVGYTPAARRALPSGNQNWLPCPGWSAPVLFPICRWTRTCQIGMAPTAPKA